MYSLLYSQQAIDLTAEDSVECSVCLMPTQNKHVQCALCPCYICIDCVKQQLYTANDHTNQHYSKYVGLSDEDQVYLRCTNPDCKNGTIDQQTLIQFLSDDQTTEKKNIALLMKTAQSLARRDQNKEETVIDRTSLTYIESKVLALVCPGCKNECTQNMEHFTGCYRLECPCGMHRCALCLYSSMNSSDIYTHLSGHCRFRFSFGDHEGCGKHDKWAKCEVHNNEVFPAVCDDQGLAFSLSKCERFLKYVVFESWETEAVASFLSNHKEKLLRDHGIDAEVMANMIDLVGDVPNRLKNIFTVLV